MEIPAVNLPNQCTWSTDHSMALKMKIPSIFKPCLLTHFLKISCCSGWKEIKSAKKASCKPDRESVTFSLQDIVHGTSSTIHMILARYQAT